MPTDLPDYTKKIAITVTVGVDQVPEGATTETPVCNVQRYSGASTTYQWIASWVVGADVIGYLAEVSLISSNYSKTLFKLDIDGAHIFTDLQIDAPLSIPFSDTKLPEATEVHLYAKSSDGTSITADGMISGKEVG